MKRTAVRKGPGGGVRGHENLAYRQAGVERAITGGHGVRAAAAVLPAYGLPQGDRGGSG